MSGLIHLKVISDGTYRGTRIIDVDTGKMLPATDLIIQIGIEDGVPFTKATITVPRLTVEYEGAAKIAGE